MYEEFPHTVEIVQIVISEVENDSGGFDEVETNTSFTMRANVSTPSSNEQYVALQRKSLYDRKMHYPYRTDITKDMRIRFEGVLYDITSKPNDLGGLHEIMRVQLTEVTV